MLYELCVDECCLRSFLFFYFLSIIHFLHYLGKPPKEIGCECCGEYFENRKGLSSHARSHLRQMGITEWSVNGSPIDTLRDVMARQSQSCGFSIKSVKKTSPSSPGPPKSSLLASSSSSPASLLSRVSSNCIQPFNIPQPLTASKSNSLPQNSCSSGLTIKLKPEPAQLEVTVSGPVERTHGFPSEKLNWNSSDSAFPLNLGNFNISFRCLQTLYIYNK